MTTKDIALNLIERHDGQKLVAGLAKRFNVLACGRRWGKTKFGLDLLVSHKTKGLLCGMPCAWAAPSYKILEEVWREAVETLDPIIKSKDASKHRIELLNGGILDCWSLDGDNPMRGRKYSLAVLDEAAFVRGLATKWNKAIRPTLADFRGEAWMLSSPAGLGDYYDFWKMGQPGEATYDEDWQSWQMGTITNPYIDPDEVASAKRTTPPLEFRQEWLGEFVTEAGIMFDTSHVNIGTPPKIERVFIGIDLAATAEAAPDKRGNKRIGDQTSFTVMGKDQSNRWWILEVHHGRWGPDQTVNEFFHFCRKWQPTNVWMEMGPLGLALKAWVGTEMRSRGEYYPLNEVSHMGNKLAKNAPFGAVCNSGMLCVPSGAKWWPDLRDEMARFNGVDGNPDDLVDSTGIVIRKAQMVYPDAAPKAPETEPPPRSDKARQQRNKHVSKARGRTPAKKGKSRLRR